MCQLKQHIYDDFSPPAIRGRLIFLITTADHRYLRQADGSCQGHIPDIISSSCDLTGKFIIYDAQPKLNSFIFLIFTVSYLCLID